MSDFDYTYLRSNNTRLKIKSLDDFIKHCSEKHKNKYDYSESVYLGNQKAISIICPYHGKFEQKAQTHIGGSGCQSCGKIAMVEKRINNPDDFSKKASAIHNGKYSYENSGYIGINHNVLITCKEHGVFEQGASSHLSGSGCPECILIKRRMGLINTGWSRGSFHRFCKNNNNGFAIVYLIRCFSDSEHFFKIGISSGSVEKRFQSFRSMPYAYEVVKVVTTSGCDAWDAEKEIHRNLREFKYSPLVSFAGDGECFKADINLIENQFKVGFKTKNIVL